MSHSSYSDLIGRINIDALKLLYTDLT